MSMKKFIMSCATFLLTAVCMANSLSCSGGGNSQLPRESAGYTTLHFAIFASVSSIALYSSTNSLIIATTLGSVSSTT